MSTPDVPAPTYVLDPSTAVPRLALPLGLGDVGVVSAIMIPAIVAAAVAWAVSGRAAAVPVTLVAGLAVSAAVCDLRTSRIPNGLVITGLVVVACSWGFVSTADDIMMRPLAGDLLAGCLLSGAPALFAVWLVAPRLVGGGDWKLLAVCGLAVGYVAPLAAVFVGLVGFSVAVVVAGVRHRRQVVLGPMLAAGYLVAVALAMLAPDFVGRTR